MLDGAEGGDIASEGADDRKDGVGRGFGELADVLQADACAGSRDNVDRHGKVWVGSLLGLGKMFL